MNGPNLAQVAVVGTLNHYRLLEQRLKEAKVRKQQAARQPDKTLSPRQERKQAKAWRRAQREGQSPTAPTRFVHDEGDRIQEAKRLRQEHIEQVFQK